jgi:hypothetical protein
VGYLPAEHFRYNEGIKRQQKLIVPRDLVAEYKPHRDKLRVSVLSRAWNPLHRVTGTYQVFILCNEIHGKLPLGRPAAFNGCRACGAFIGRNPRQQSFDTFAAEGITLCSNPVCIDISRFALCVSPKEAFGGALEERRHEIGGDNSHVTSLKWYFKDLCRLAESTLDSYLRILQEKAALRRILYGCQHLANRATSGDASAEIAATARELFANVAARDGSHTAWRTFRLSAFVVPARSSISASRSYLRAQSLR